MKNSETVLDENPAAIPVPSEEALGGPMHRIPDSLSEQMVRLYRGWHTFERENAGPSIVDFDLSDISGQSLFSSRDQVLRDLKELREKLSQFDFHEAIFLRSRVGGSVTYLRAMMGEQIPFGSYLQATLGVEPAPVSEEEINLSRLDAERALQACGLTYSPECAASFEKTFFTDPERIAFEILSQKELWLRRLADNGIPVPGLLPLEVKFDQVDAYWSNWIAGSAHSGLTLTINLHERTRYDEGRALFLCLHEICGHAVQMSIWRDRIKLKQISQACGVTTVHSPETFVAEGLGQTVAELLNEYETPPVFHVNRALRYHTLLVLHNAHIGLYKGVPVEKVFDEARHLLPFSKPDELLAQLSDRGTNILHRSYLLSYSAGEAYIRGLVRDDGARKKELFRALYTLPMSPGQLMDRFGHAASS